MVVCVAADAVAVHVAAAAVAARVAAAAVAVRVAAAAVAVCDSTDAGTVPGRQLAHCCRSWW